MDNGTRALMFMGGIVLSIITTIFCIISAFRLRNIGLKILFIFLALVGIGIAGMLLFALAFSGLGSY